jgi:hypothetical protein
MLSRSGVFTARRVRGAITDASVLRRFSADGSVAAAAKADKKDAGALSDDAPVGKFYSDLLYRGRGVSKFLSGKNVGLICLIVLSPSFCIAE